MANLGKIIYLSEAQKNELFTNDSVTSNGTTITYSDNDLYVTPDANVEDVLVGGVSVVSNNSAIIPVATANTYGVAKIGDFGVQIVNTGVNIGKLHVDSATTSQIKEGAGIYKPIAPNKQHEATFYGLTKAAGVDMSSSSNEVGTYTDAAKDAIQNMLGVSNLISTRENPVATTAHTANSLFLMDGKLHKATSAIEIGSSIVAGTNCQVVKADEVFIKNTDYATTNNAGIVKISSAGFQMINDNTITLNCANATKIKAGTAYTTALCPAEQHTSIYYGLSKLAGVDLANETVTVGTYPTASKAAIQSMLGIETSVSLKETVTGTTPSIIGIPNTIYECGEVSTLSITPPANGTIDVYFTSGNTATVLTVPNTVKFPTWFDATALEANTIYEIMITNGVYGGVTTWAAT